MSKNMDNKKIVMEYNNSIYGASSDNIDSILSKYYHNDIDWHGPQPFNDISGRKDVVETFYKPLIQAVPDLQKYAYIHFGGTDPLFPKDEWVVSSGNYLGTFQKDWLGIPCNQRSFWMRYIEYNKVVDGKIVQTYMLIDIMDFIRQAGVKFMQSPGAEINVPGPSTLDGVIMNEVNSADTEKTFKLVEDMCWKALMSFKEKGQGKMGLENYMIEDFMWYGPCGIGSTRGLKGFEKCHQDPFLKSVPDRTYPNRTTDEKNAPFFAEGNYAGYIWWSGFEATHTGNDWLGMSATGRKLNIRCADIYRRDAVENKLAENWVLLDIIDILMQMGINVFDRLKNDMFTIKAN